jgi:hypothetical protein
MVRTFLTCYNANHTDLPSDYFKIFMGNEILESIVLIAELTFSCRLAHYWCCWPTTVFEGEIIDSVLLRGECT